MSLGKSLGFLFLLPKDHIESPIMSFTYYYGYLMDLLKIAKPSLLGLSGARL